MSFVSAFYCESPTIAITAACSGADKIVPGDTGLNTIALLVLRAVCPWLFAIRRGRRVLQCCHLEHRPQKFGLVQTVRTTEVTTSRRPQYEDIYIPSKTWAPLG